MDEIIYNAITKYYKALEKLGYYSYDSVFSLLLLCFYRDFVYEDFRSMLNKDDYHLIERALNCLFGRNCLIPYPKYLKMGKLYIGEITELAQRVKELEDTQVLKSDDPDETLESDIIITEQD